MAVGARLAGTWGAAPSALRHPFATGRRLRREAATGEQARQRRRHDQALAVSGRRRARRGTSVQAARHAKSPAGPRPTRGCFSKPALAPGNSEDASRGFDAVCAAPSAWDECAINRAIEALGWIAPGNSTVPGGEAPNIEASSGKSRSCAEMRANQSLHSRTAICVAVKRAYHPSRRPMERMAPEAGGLTHGRRKEGKCRQFSKVFLARVRFD